MSTAINIFTEYSCTHSSKPKLIELLIFYSFASIVTIFSSFFDHNSMYVDVMDNFAHISMRTEQPIQA